MKYFITLFCAIVLSVGLYAQASLQIFHNSPTLGTLSGPVVDVYVNGQLSPALTNFNYLRASPTFGVPSDTSIHIGIALAGSISVADTFANFVLDSLEDQQFHQLILAGVVGDTMQPFEAYLNREARDLPQGSTLNFNFFHGLSDAGDVDIRFRRFGLINDQVMFGEYTSYLNINPGAGYIIVDVLESGTGNILNSYYLLLQNFDNKAFTLVTTGFMQGMPANKLYAVFPDGIAFPVPETQVGLVQFVNSSYSSTYDAVDIYVDGTLMVNDLNSLNGTAYLPFNFGIREIAVAPDTSTSANSAFLTQNVSVSNGSVTQVFLTGDSTTPIDIHINSSAQNINDSLTTIVHNFFQGALHSDAYDVSYRLDAQPLADSLLSGEYAPYVMRPVGDYIVDITNATTGEMVGSYFAPFGSAGGAIFTYFTSGIQPDVKLYVVLANGSVFPLPRIAASQLQFVHASPTVDVDIYLDTILIVDDLSYLHATPYDFFEAGETLEFYIAPANSTSSAEAFDSLFVVLDTANSYQVFAAGIPGSLSQPFGLYVKDNARSVSSSSDIVDIEMFNAAISETDIDIWRLNPNQVLANDLAFGSFADSYRSLAAGPTYLRAFDDEDESIRTFLIDLSAGGGTAATLFAAQRDSSQGPLSLYYVTPDGEVYGSEFVSALDVQLIHNAPSAMVDLYVNGDLFYDNLPFRGATPFVTLFQETQDTLRLSVAPANSDTVTDAYYQEMLSFEDGDSYILMANGIVGNAEYPFNLELLEDAHQRSQVNSLFFDVNVFHGAPDVPTFKAAVDGVPFAEEISYGHFGSYYTSIPISQYLFSLAQDNDEPIGSGPLNLNNLGGQAGIVFATGFIDTNTDPDFELWIALPDGTTYPLSFILGVPPLDYAIESAKLYPNPAMHTTAFTVELTTAIHRAQLMLFDAQGKLIQQRRLGDLEQGSYKWSWDVAQLPAGTYMMSLFSAEGYMSYPLQVVSH